MLHPITTDTGTNSVVNTAILGHETSGTPAAGYGTGLLFAAEDASVSNRNLGRLYFSWVSATNASRSGQGVLDSILHDHGAHGDAVRYATSSDIQLGFFGQTPASKPSIT